MYNINNIMTTRIEQMKDVHAEALELFRKKNNDYGDSFATYGPIGVIIRMGDKISRLNSVTNSGIHLVNTESVRDTLIDLHNYSAMAIMLLDEPLNPEPDQQFPKTPNHIPILHQMTNRPTSNKSDKKISLPIEITSNNNKQYQNPRFSNI